MEQTDSDKFSRLFADVMAYYRQNVSEFTQDLFWNACQGFDFEQVQKAFNQHAKDPEHGQFPPKVADLVRILNGTHTDRAQLAWGKAFKAMSSVGAYQDVVFDDPAIHAAIEDLGGWQKVCRTESKDIGYLQHRFCESHRAYSGRGDFEYPKRLYGDRSPDDEYTRRGIPLPKPALVGDVEMCRQVYLGGNKGGKTAIGYQSIASLVANHLTLENK